MCDFFWQRLETADQGDLADIVRASGGGGSSTAAGASSSSSTVGMDSWQRQQQQLHIDQPAASAVAAFPPPPVDDFGGLLHDLAGTSRFFGGPPGGGGGGGGDVLDAQRIQMFADEAIKRPGSNLFSRVLQISPNNKPPPLPPSPTLADRPMPISSPCTPGLKRRKSQAKKVVCIPAPAAASNRPSGEVVPSDLWAWRKYGQKPIKGSPYPRGYYRCSSSKGCSARKQVERSRTDPNMLVITYTSEHNHPWPTQRNALAGSTRSQPAKNSSASSASKTSGHHQNQRSMAGSNIKEEPNESMTTETTSSGLVAVKEETVGSGTTSSLSTDDFFSDLAELDPDPMSLVFSSQEEKIKSKALDSFIDIFDWGGGSSFGDHQAKKGL